MNETANEATSGTAERRRAERLAVALPARVVSEDGIHAAETVDIS